jgi:chromate transporter
VGNPSVKAFVDGVTATATGAIAGAAFVLGRRAVIDIPTVLICLGTLFILVRAKGVSEPVIILAAGIVGIVIKTAAAG